MQNKNYIYVVVGVLVGILLVNIFPSLASVGLSARYPNMMNGANNMMGQGGQGNMTGDLDRHFIEQMIPHHEDAVTMAELALQKAKKAEIKTLAQAIIIAQTKEIDEMRGWYKNWFGSDVPDSVNYMGHSMMNHSQGMMMGGMMGDETDMAVLKSAQDFDAEFIRQMIPHHQTAVMMAQMVAVTSSRDEIKKLAQDVVQSQTNEINQMREWYRSWYN
ncbi:MAG: DUF305 domain-containing protein [Patescibacteria group bacterium]